MRSFAGTAKLAPTGCQSSSACTLASLRASRWTAGAQPERMPQRTRGVSCRCASGPVAPNPASRSRSARHVARVMSSESPSESPIPKRSGMSTIQPWRAISAAMATSTRRLRLASSDRGWMHRTRPRGTTPAGGSSCITKRRPPMRPDRKWGFQRAWPGGSGELGLDETAEAAKGLEDAGFDLIVLDLAAEVFLDLGQYTQHRHGIQFRYAAEQRCRALEVAGHRALAQG